MDWTRYTSADEDSGRWEDFPFRRGDIVISTRSKSGTTWMQMICALLVFRTPELPEPLSALSPWLDWLVTPRDEVIARLEAQRHRRFVKTHTPLDGVPLDPRATYIVVARHPLDMAVSLHHQSANIVRERSRALPPLDEWLLDWISRDVSHLEEMDSLPGVMWHLSDAWSRSEPNVVLVHYDDLLRDLPGEMRRLAGILGIDVPEDVWPSLVDAATFASMRARASVPTPPGVLKDDAAFFRRGTSGEGRAALTPADLARYHERAAALAPPDLLTWLHRD
ncbi:MULTISPECIES: sulfotransferase domain-containing protein [Actinomadura]|uniref:Sulfotransferase domain-containing protein n=1 Tax=Actinomadura yumaensis TaxID=111807 RepID=A0ABW2CCJ9_9ACTN|nr:sulfotransferase domain-containing protein [Actinomadura sp. J1-007]MWK35551.1 sulfotransferase domain-containing protein [Actinomadura sp. J1-007]